MMWETVSGAMMTKVKWFYHPQEIETCGRKFDLKLPVSGIETCGRKFDPNLREPDSHLLIAIHF